MSSMCNIKIGLWGIHVGEVGTVKINSGWVKSCWLYSAEFSELNRIMIAAVSLLRECWRIVHDIEGWLDKDYVKSVLNRGTIGTGEL